MAWEQPGFSITRIAGADLSSAQFTFVKVGAAADEVIQCSANTDCPMGVLQNAPPEHGEAVILVIGVTKLKTHADLAYGNLIGSEHDGTAAAYVPGTDTTKYIVGQVLQENTAAGGVISALINCANPHRGA